MDGVPLIVVNKREGLENNDENIEILQEDVDGMHNLSVYFCRSCLRSLLSLMANRSHQPSKVKRVPMNL